MIKEYVFSFVFNTIKKQFKERNKSNYFSKNIGGVARKAKRFVIYIMSEGLPGALLFAYSKAKFTNLKNFDEKLRGAIDGLGGDKETWGETYDWLVICKFTIDFIKKYFKELEINQFEPENILEKLIRNENKLNYIEEKTIEALNTLAMLCFALEEE